MLSLHLLNRIWMGALFGLLATSNLATADLIDPTGDTFGIGPVQHDIVRATAELDQQGVTHFRVDFARPVAAPSAITFNSVVGYLDVDRDSNPLTGNPNSFVNQLGGCRPWRWGAKSM